MRENLGAVGASIWISSKLGLKTLNFDSQKVN
jgi:hypothetical protein